MLLFYLLDEYLLIKRKREKNDNAFFRFGHRKKQKKTEQSCVGRAKEIPNKDESVHSLELLMQKRCRHANAHRTERIWKCGDFLRWIFCKSIEINSSSCCRFGRHRSNPFYCLHHQQTNQQKMSIVKSTWKAMLEPFDLLKSLHKRKKKSKYKQKSFSIANEKMKCCRTSARLFARTTNEKKERGGEKEKKTDSTDSKNEE